MMVFAYALFVPAGVGLTSAFGSQLLASTLHVTIAPWALFIVVLTAAVFVAYLGITTSASVDLLLVAGEIAVIAALAITILVKIGPAHYSAAVFSASSPNQRLADLTDAMIYGFAAFAGFEAAAALGEEAKNSRRSVPVSIVGIVVVTGIFYLLVVCAEAFAAGRHGIAGLIGQASPLGYLTSRFWSPSVLWSIDLVIVLAGLQLCRGLGQRGDQDHVHDGTRTGPARVARPLSHRRTPVAAIGCLAVITLLIGLPATAHPRTRPGRIRGPPHTHGPWLAALLPTSFLTSLVRAPDCPAVTTVRHARGSWTTRHG